MRQTPRISSVALLGVTALLACGHTQATPTYLDQGTSWNDSARLDFYSRDQGSQIMPLSWAIALKQADGSPFMAASLGRYGYLANPQSTPPGLPVGFTAVNSSNGQNLGMTCSACHTRQIEVDGQAYRIDGGPAISDFQSFLADLDTAVGQVLAQPAEFDAFAASVLGSVSSPTHKAELRLALEDWYQRYHTLVSRALPREPWGPARLDAVSMIFNRLTGLDIGPPPSYLIPENIQEAVAPVRYPFLWNAYRQDKTQWPGFANNGNDLLGLARNLGEVYGVFGVFHPKPDKKDLLKIDYLSGNSANFHGLKKVEELIAKIGPPKWPWTVDTALAKQGEAIYNRPQAQGGCTDCHGIKRGAFRTLAHETWATPVQDVGTDSREHEILTMTVQTGVLNGAKIPFLEKALKPTDTAFNVLSTAVVGTILQHYAQEVLGKKTITTRAVLYAPATSPLSGAFRAEAIEPDSNYPYEARVLQGIWAAAPYLHNGSVPSLAELLKPAAERVVSFKVGPAYDTQAIGLAAEQREFGDYRLTTTDCSARNSGNSRCGHEFGTTLPAADKQALLEYLKTL
ncbi:MAG: di-heme-cytochrome C peroxidase [Pseudomonas sp.]|uniref:di-heme-cytochrome C peroxidase n=1 Tax=Pseudomonas sp. TaxID=306 RepID=UPI003398736A